MSGHRSDIKHNRKKPVDAHFNEPDHMLKNLRFTVIKKVTLENLRFAVIKKVKSTTKLQREVEEQKQFLNLTSL